jgi:hypothetical protein
MASECEPQVSLGALAEKGGAMSATKIAEQGKGSPYEICSEKAPDQAPASCMTPLLAFSIVLLFVLIIVAGLVLILA